MVKYYSSNHTAYYHFFHYYGHQTNFIHLRRKRMDIANTQQISHSNSCDHTQSAIYRFLAFRRYEPRLICIPCCFWSRVNDWCVRRCCFYEVSRQIPEGLLAAGQEDYQFELTCDAGENVRVSYRSAQRINSWVRTDSEEICCTSWGRRWWVSCLRCWWQTGRPLPKKSFLFGHDSNCESTISHHSM